MKIKRESEKSNKNRRKTTTHNNKLSRKIMGRGKRRR